MISFQQLRRFFLTTSLTILLAITIAFGFVITDSLAAISLTQLIGPQPQFAIFNRVETMNKNIEGKTQEAMGNMTGDRQDQFMGKAKQVESQARNAAEDMEDKMKLTGRTKAFSKNIEGKAQEAKGNITGNRQDQFAGQAKQVESQARNAVEDVKDNVRRIFN